jgi:hypothetical protein
MPKRVVILRLAPLHGSWVLTSLSARKTSYVRLRPLDVVGLLATAPAVGKLEGDLVALLEGSDSSPLEAVACTNWSATRDPRFSRPISVRRLPRDSVAGLRDLTSVTILFAGDSA